MTDVFISYSRKDQDFVRKLYDALNAQERQAWVDWEGIPITADWWAEISRGIEAADTFLFIISPDSVISQTCNREVEHAVLHHKRIVPIVRREALPEQMNSALSRHNWLFAREDDDFDDCFTRLMDALNTDLDYVRGHTRLLVRAREWESKHKDGSYLLRGVELQEAENWLAQSGGKEPKPTELQTNYILASRRASNARQRTLLVGVTGALAITVILALVAVGLFGVAQSQRQISEARGTEVVQQASTAIAAEATSARRAVEWRGLAWSAASSQALTANDGDLALALALQALSIPNPPVEVLTQTRNAIYAPGAAQIYSGVHNDWINSFALSADERWMLSSCKDGSLALYDAATGEVLQSMQFGESFVVEQGLTINFEAVDPVVFHPTMPEIAALGFSNGLIGILNVETWEITQTADFPGSIVSMSFSPDGSMLAVGRLGDTNLLTMYDTETLEPVGSFEGHSEGVQSVRFSADGTQLLSGSDDATARLWDVATGDLIRTFGEITDPIESQIDIVGAVFAPPDANDRPTIILATNSGRILTFDRDTGDQLMDYDTGVSGTRLADIAISPDGRTLLSAGYDSVVSLWRTRDGRLLRSFRGHTASIARVSFSQDGVSIYSGALDATIRRWYARSGGEAFRVNGFEDGGAALTLDFTHDESLAVVGGGQQDPAVLVWETDSGTLRYRLEGHTDTVQSLDIYQDASGANLAATGSWDGTIRIWNLDTGEAVRTLDVRGNVVASIDINAEATQALIAVFNPFTSVGEIEVIDLESGDPVQTYDPDFTLYLDAAYSSDESTILIGGTSFTDGGRIAVIDAATGEVTRDFPQVHNTAVSYAVFNGDGTRAISSSQDGLIVEWDVATGGEVQRYSGHGDSASQVTFTPDERWIASGSYDDTYRIWDRQTGLPQLILAADDDGRAVAFTSDGTLYTVSRDGSLTRWALTFDPVELVQWAQNNRYVRDFTCYERQTNRIDPQCEGN